MQEEGKGSLDQQNLLSLVEKRDIKEQEGRQRLVDELLRNLVESDKELEAAGRRAAKRASKLQGRQNQASFETREKIASNLQRNHTPHHSARHSSHSQSRGFGQGSTPNQIHKEKLYSKDKVSPKRVADSLSHERVRDKYEPLKNWIHRDHDEGYAKSHPKSFAVRHVPDVPAKHTKNR